MNKAQAINGFFLLFGVPAYEENSVPDGAELPYITYQLIDGFFGNEQPIAASIWAVDGNGRSALKSVVDKGYEIGAKLGRGGVFIKCDGGMIWLKRGEPFSQIMGDAESGAIKRNYINLTAEFLTAE